MNEVSKKQQKLMSEKIIKKLEALENKDYVGWREEFKEVISMLREGQRLAKELNKPKNNQ